MKKRVAILCTCMLWCGILLCAQNISGGVIDAFKQGNAESLVGYLDSKVELVIDSRVLKSDKQAVGKQLAAFFTKHKVDGFLLNHQGQRNESGFMVGTLTTSSEVFRVNCFLRKSGSQYVIHQIRINASNE